MSLSIDGFWKSGFWTETFWADGFWFEGDPVIPPVVTTRGGGVDHQRKRKKAKLSDKPLEHLDLILKKAVKEVFAELTDKKAPKKVKKQTNKLVSKYAEVYRPKIDQVDWDALSQDIDAVQLLLGLYQKEIADKAMFDMIENENIEFLLMH